MLPLGPCCHSFGYVGLLLSLFSPFFFFSFSCILQLPISLNPYWFFCLYKPHWTNVDLPFFINFHIVLFDLINSNFELSEESIARPISNIPPIRASRAVDEDLYKISPQLLHYKPTRVIHFLSFFFRRKILIFFFKVTKL